MSVLTDDFNRADGAIGGNWTAINSSLKVQSNQATDNGASSTALARYSAAQLATADQYVQAKVGAYTAGATATAYLIARCNAATSIATALCYAAYLAAASGVITGGLWYYSAGGALNWLWGPAASIQASPLLAGDLFRLEVAGGSVRYVFKGVEKMVVSDSHVASGGYSGVGVSATSSQLLLDDFEAGDLNRGKFLAVA